MKGTKKHSNSRAENWSEINFRNSFVISCVCVHFPLALSTCFHLFLIKNHASIFANNRLNHFMRNIWLFFIFLFHLIFSLVSLNVQQIMAQPTKYLLIPKKNCFDKEPNLSTISLCEPERKTKRKNYKSSDNGKYFYSR